ncbi:hypothetical protein [Xanthomonas hortorum]|uniref:hypothetical protein n=1 Tax=Xanthomonas hortorum TaxID=56454 RepID=UPI000A4E0738|nr:hypothetical protein [Xanthomonas hortorum]
MQKRLHKIENRLYPLLSVTDSCSYYGEYTSGGTYQASETNQLIFNLKNKPTSSSGKLHYKEQAINHWGVVLSQVIDVPKTIGNFTFVPMPGSKPIGHPDYDDRMLRVLRRMAYGITGVDVRPILKQVVERQAQHHGTRMTPDELCESLAIDREQLQQPINKAIVIVDDVITKGASFVAAKQLLSSLPGVNFVVGVFLAKTVWPAPLVPTITSEQLRAILGR